MKKTLLIILSLLIAGTVSVKADPDPLHLIIKPLGPGDDNGNTGGGANPKSPIYIPVVYQDGNVLTFDSALEGCTVRLLDEDEVVIFTDSIGENQTSLVLPSALTGTYELQIVAGDITYWCYIEL